LADREAAHRRDALRGSTHGGEEAVAIGGRDVGVRTEEDEVARHRGIVYRSPSRRLPLTGSRHLGTGGHRRAVGPTPSTGPRSSATRPTPQRPMPDERGRTATAASGYPSSSRFFRFG